MKQNRGHIGLHTGNYIWYGVSLELLKEIRNSEIFKLHRMKYITSLFKQIIFI